MKHSIYAISGSGAVGEYPLDPATWSGSSAFFFREIERRNGLQGTIGGEIPFWQKAMFALVNYSRDPAVLRLRMYSDVRYRNALSRLLAQQIRTVAFDPGALSIQLGSMFNLNDVLKSRCRYSSYNDGNFQMSLSSPYFPKKDISTKMIDAAIRYEKNVLDGMQTIFTMSEFLRQSFINDYGQPPDKVVCIGAGVNLSESFIQSILNTSLTEKNYDSQEILFIGVDFLRKGGNHLLEAFRHVRSVKPKAKLHIIGPTQPLRDFESESGVFWHGFLRKSDPNDAARLKEIFFNSSLLVMPSVYEPFGIAPLESMLNGVPVIVSNRWALPELVPEGQVGELVPPANPPALAEKMILLLNDPNRLKMYGQKGRSWVLENFLWTKVVDRLERFLETI